MPTSQHFCVIAIPLNRTGAIEFLLPPAGKPKGAKLEIVGQRPTAEAESSWIQRLRRAPVPTLTDFLEIDNPGHNLLSSTSDRLVPIEFLAKPDFLTRGLGGWTPIYFGVARLPAQITADPLFEHLEILADYGEKVRYFGADENQVAGRLESEAGCQWPAILSALLHLHSLRPHPQGDEAGISSRTTYIEKLYQALLSGSQLATTNQPPVPKILLYDELLSQMTGLELSRRRYLVNGESWLALRIRSWQEAWRQETGLTIVVKGEYIAGRHRGSLVLIAPELGVVIKQPAPEPFHEILLNARSANGQSENWPMLTQDGALVTSRGRVRLLLEEGLIPRLHQVFQHGMACSTLMGFTLEDFVFGQTVQDYVSADHERMTADLYDVFVLHQQTCEILGIENGDWHSANFILRESDGEAVHVDWGAARPLRDDERTPKDMNARLNQIQNIAFSFHNQALAERVKALHSDLMANEQRLQRIRQRAQVLVDDVARN